MPIYEYVCEACDKRFEKLVRTMNSQDKAVCPECGSKQTSRSLSVFAVGAESPRGGGAPAGGAMCGRCGGPGPCGME